MEPAAPWFLQEMSSGYFISYPRERESEAADLASFLRLRKLRYWIDLEHLVRTGDPAREIRQGIGQVGAVLMLPTLSGGLTPWMHYEVGASRALEKPVYVAQPRRHLQTKSIRETFVKRSELCEVSSYWTLPNGSSGGAFEWVQEDFNIAEPHSTV